MSGYLQRMVSAAHAANESIHPVTDSLFAAALPQGRRASSSLAGQEPGTTEKSAAGISMDIDSRSIAAPSEEMQWLMPGSIVEPTRKTPPMALETRQGSGLGESENRLPRPLSNDSPETIRSSVAAGPFEPSPVVSGAERGVNPSAQLIAPAAEIPVRHAVSPPLPNDAWPLLKPADPDPHHRHESKAAAAPLQSQAVVKQVPAAGESLAVAKKISADRTALDATRSAPAEQTSRPAAETIPAATAKPLPTVVAPVPQPASSWSDLGKRRELPARSQGVIHRQDRVEIHIGRIEVVAVQPPARAVESKPAPKTQSLSEYLKRGHGRA